MPIHELAALGAALCWALSGVMSAGPVAALGPFGFNLIRQSFVAVVLALIVLAAGRWHEVRAEWLVPLILSGFVGIFLGDMMLFLALGRLGPRRSGALFAMNAPMAAVLGWLFLGETLSVQGIAGVALCSVGVAICVLGRGGAHRLEALQGHVGTGVAFGLLAALGQAGGSLIARPAMEAGMDPLTGSLIRVTVAAACLALLTALRLPATRLSGSLTRPVAVQIVGSGLLAMVVGMTLLLFALQGGKVGVVSTLSALSPVVILPVIWAVTGERPGAASWLGALIAVTGMALIFLR